MKVAIIGSDGQLGTDLVKIFQQKGEEVFPLTHAEIEVVDYDSCQKSLDLLKPEVVINTAAFHQVDECEKYPEKAFAVNTQGAFNVGGVCRELGARCVFISTDYVFSGLKGGSYTERQAADPVNIYGVSKLAGEIWVLGISEHNLVVRTCGLFGEKVSKKGWNFVEKIIRLAKEKGTLKVVDDQFVSPTATFYLAEKIHQLVGGKAAGIFHVTSEGHCSWYQFTKKILELTGVPCDLHPVASAEFPSPAKRPDFSVLESERLQKEGYGLLPDWQEALAEYLIRQDYQLKK